MDSCWSRPDLGGSAQQRPAMQSIGINLEDFHVVEVKPDSCTLSNGHQILSSHSGAFHVCLRFAPGSSFEAELFLTSAPVFRWDTDVHSPTEESTAVVMSSC